MPAPPGDPYRAFTQTPEEFWERYQSWQIEVENRFKAAHARQGMDAAVTDAILRTNTSNKELLDALDFDEGKELVEDFRRNVLRFDEGFIEDAYQGIGLGGGGSEVGRFVPEYGISKRIWDHPLAFVLRGMSISKKDPAATGAEAFSFGRNIPRVDFVKNAQETLKQGIGEGQSIFVFDTETLGLSTEQASVRELSGLTVTKADGRLSLNVQDMMTKHMHVARSAYGSIRDGGTGKTIRMDDYIRGLAGGDISGSAADGATFLRNTLPALEQMAKADYIAGHNVGFDISQIVTNAMKTSHYLNNTPLDDYTDVRGIVNKVVEKINKGQVLDSLRMAEEYFGNNIDLAPEFASMGQPRPFSLENLMLETNLAQLMEEDEPGFLLRMGKAQHQADVDTVITARLIDYIQSGRLSDQYRLGASGDPAELAMRRNVLTSWAPTPVSNIADVRNISRDMFRRLFAEKEGVVIRELLGDEPIKRAGTADEWYDTLTSDSNLKYVASTKVTPQEQHVFHTRKNLTIADEVGSVVDNIGMWAGYSKFNTPYEGVLNRLHTLFKRAEVPDDTAFAAFQERMAKAGMPFAGLSLEERILTGGLASAARQKSTVRSLLRKHDPRDLRAIAVGDDLGVSNFSLRDKFFVTKSNVLSMPLSVVMEAEKAGKLKTVFNSTEDVQMLSMSTVDKSKSLNLMAQISESEARDMVEWLDEVLNTDTDTILRRQLMQSGLDNEMLGRIKASFLAEKGYERGINVAYLDEAAGRQAYHTLNDMLQGLTRDEDKIPYRVGFMDARPVGDEGAGVMRTGAVVLDRWRTKEERAAYRTNLDIAQQRYAQLRDELPNAFEGIKSKTRYATGSDVLARRAESIHHGLRRYGPMGIGAAALVFGGYYATKRYRKQQEYDESMSTMDYQDEASYNRYREEEMGLPPAPAVRKLDPLATAGVVGNLHNNAIGHTSMSPHKNDGLFSGV